MKPQEGGIPAAVATPPQPLATREIVLFAAALLVALAASSFSRKALDHHVGEYRTYISPPTAAASGDMDFLHQALRRAREAGPRREFYRELFFEERVKFIYPPAAMLPFYLSPDAGTVSSTRRAQLVLRFLAFFTAVLAVGLLARAWRAAGGTTPWPSGRVAAAFGGCVVGGAALLFYPLARAVHINQLQTVVALLQTLMLLAVLEGKPRWGGAFLAVAAVIKPHLGLIALWAVVRRRWGFVGTFLAVLGAGTGLGILAFGWQNLVVYATEVLPALARTGEAYVANQSMNGVLNRVLHTGDPLRFSREVYPSAQPIVVWASGAAALVLLAIGCWISRRAARGRLGDALAAGALMLTATMSSTIAWEHHYSCLVPLLALLFPAIRVGGSSGRTLAGLFWGGYALTAFYWEVRPVALGGRAVFSAPVYGGAILLVVLLARLTNPRRLKVPPSGQSPG